jgi:glycosyltransferase involved in cell wall biosynthesis
LLAWLDQLPAVERVAPMAQTQLAGWLRTVHWLAYPCTWIETSCISVMEAYAAGCRVLATDLGALPETCAGRADLLPHGAPDLASLVAQGLLDRIVARQQDPTEGLDEAWERVCYANQALRWDDRARRWALLFKAMAA